MEYRDISFGEFLGKIKGTVFKILIAFIVIMLVLTVVYNFNILGLADTLNKMFGQLTESFKELANEDGSINTVSLILNNIRVSFMAFFLGVIPFLYLPVFVLIINAGIIGILLGYMMKFGVLTTLSTFALGILPHGILELPAIFISLACGITLCSSITRTILRKETEMTVSQVVINSMKTLVLICVPLMIVAGVIETQITPRLLTMFTM